MKQIHKPYYTWECYKNGMFDIDKKQNEDLLIKKSEYPFLWSNSSGRFIIPDKLLTNGVIFSSLPFSLVIFSR